MGEKKKKKHVTFSICISSSLSFPNDKPNSILSAHNYTQKQNELREETVLQIVNGQTIIVCTNSFEIPNQPNFSPDISYEEVKKSKAFSFNRISSKNLTSLLIIKVTIVQYILKEIVVLRHVNAFKF